MKIRAGFVSNSSSSSYIVVGNKVSFNSIRSNNLDSIMIVPKQSSDDGYYFIEMDKEIYAYLKANPGATRTADFYDVIAFGEEDIVVDRSKLPSKVHIFSMDVTYHNPDTLEEFKRIMEGDVEGGTD